MSSQQVSAWQPVIVKGATFEKTFRFEDENGTPVTFTSAQIDVFPNGDTPFSWTQANGKFTNTAPGDYLLALDETETATYLWTSGTYRLNAIEGGVDAYPCLIGSLIFAKDC